MASELAKSNVRDELTSTAQTALVNLDAAFRKRACRGDSRGANEETIDWGIIYMFKFSGLNYVNVGPNGTFTPSGRLTTTPADVDAIFANLVANQTKKLAIHFHGGLIKEGAGLEIARKLAPVYAGAGCHPVTFVWETGLVETVTRSLGRLNETKLFQKLVEYVIRQAVKRLGGGIGGKGPEEALSSAEVALELQREDAFDRLGAGVRDAAARLDEAGLNAQFAEIEAELTEEFEADAEFARLVESGMAETEHLNPEMREAVAPGEAKGLIATATLVKAAAVVTFNVLRRYIRRSDHGLYPTVIEELLREVYLADFGAWVWQGMKDVAEKMWVPNVNPVDANSHVGSYFVGKLAAHQAVHPDLAVDLIGHSAGAIAICELYKAAEARNLSLKIRNVLFLAPACRSDLFLAEIVGHPERFAAFRMFTMKDEWESRDRLVPGVYTRSLLYFISGALEDSADVPVAGLARHFSGVAPYDTPDLLKIRGWLTAAGANRLVLAKTEQALAGFGSMAIHHGDFDDEEVTRASLVTLVAA